jgi:hypothetical protein
LAERLARHFDARLQPWILPDSPGVLSYEAQRIGNLALGAEWRGGVRQNQNLNGNLKTVPLDFNRR